MRDPVFFRAFVNAWNAVFTFAAYGATDADSSRIMLMSRPQDAIRSGLGAGTWLSPGAAPAEPNRIRDSRTEAVTNTTCARREAVSSCPPRFARSSRTQDTQPDHPGRPARGMGPAEPE